MFFEWLFVMCYYCCNDSRRVRPARSIRERVTTGALLIVRQHARQPQHLIRHRHRPLPGICVRVDLSRLWPDSSAGSIECTLVCSGRPSTSEVSCARASGESGRRTYGARGWCAPSSPSSRGERGGPRPRGTRRGTCTRRRLREWLKRREREAYPVDSVHSSQ